jgi:hypothetical protein
MTGLALNINVGYLARKLGKVAAAELNFKKKPGRANGGGIDVM